MVWFWAFAFVTTLVIEIISVELVSIWFTFGALVAFILALFEVGITIQIVVFLIVSTILLASLRAIFIKFLKNSNEKTNIDLIIGKVVTLEKDITENEAGEVKINGVTWRVVSSDNSSIKSGEKVQIVEIQGNKFIVKKETIDE